MAGGQEKWYFTKEQLQISPSRKCGLDADKELSYRQQAANLIQDMGQRLQVSQLCINTAIVYMHRFYAFHSFTQFHRNAIAAAALFLAAKVEEQPRKLEYVIKVAHICIHRGEGPNTLAPEHYQEQAQDLVFNENVLLQTLGFDVAIDHPHTHVVRTCHLVKAPKDLAQTSYFMASNSLHLTTMCLQYRPTVVACFCIHLASKWSNWAIPQSNEGRHWFSYVDRSVTSDLLERLTAEFLHIFDKCPSRLKKKMMTMNSEYWAPVNTMVQRLRTSPPFEGGSSPHTSGGGHGGVPNSPFDKKHHSSINTDEMDKSFDKEYELERRRQPMPGGYVPAAPAPTTQPQKIELNAYREKKEKEERDRRQAMQQRPGQPPARPGQPPARPGQPPPRPSTSQHKPHGWPHKPTHKPHEHKSHEHKPHEHKLQEHKLQEHKLQEHKLQEHKLQEHKLQEHKLQDHKLQEQKLQDHKLQEQKLQEHRHHRPQPPHQEQRTRPPSLFSPENTIPSAAAAAAPRRPQPQPPNQPQPSQSHQRPPRPEARPIPQPTQPIQERPPSPIKKRPDPAMAIREMLPPAILSPFSSPPGVKEVKEQKPRPRTHSNSEPELVPVVKKLDETPGYEHVIRDSQKASAIKAKEHRRPEAVQRSLNGIETDPTLVSNLLKESLAKPAPITVPTERKSPLIEIKKEPPSEPPAAQQPPPPPQPEPPAPQQPPEETKHKKEKKKKDKHKHKDRDKSKEERKKHKKDKDKKKDPTPPPPVVEPQDGPLRITIPREKLATSPGLKIKIPKDRLTQPLPQQSSLKIKISKEVLETSRKRLGGDAGPPPKMARHNGAPPKVAEPALGNGHAAK